ncbi:hypothetical protein [Hymenobacter crusticola]|uniref:DUF4382 domain-containing protein n=1 Tax=Hymenobacter crusticola TaxID=1770526 RepID=A0A243WIF8_9BACT|nr:hypothetical protein [Hymenobacter crusticola]OUJ74789.1 hypothetical protein BXP70_08515 [Hymenobacter crusticola]
MSSLVLASCGKDNKNDDPIPVKTHVVSVRVAGRDLAGLGAELQVTSQLVAGGKSQEGPQAADQYIDTADKTYNIGTFSNADVVTATIAFKNVTRTSSPRPPLSSALAVVFIIDGQTNQSVTLDAKGIGSGVSYTPYLSGTTAVQMDKL